MSSPISHYSSPVAEWRSHYSKNYIARAIHTEEVVKTVLEQRRLAPAEDTLRKQGNALPQLKPEEIEKLRELEAAIEAKEDVVVETEDDVAIEIEEDTDIDIPIDYDLYRLPYTITIRENCGHAKKTFECQRDTKLGGAVGKFFAYVAELSKKYATEAVMIVYDQSKPKQERFDAKLAAVFQRACTKHGLKNYFDKEAQPGKKRLYIELSNALAQARKHVFGALDITNTVEVKRNQIDWDAGAVVVLRGDPKETIGSVVKEVKTLAPWQNGGKFFRLKLEGKESLILGPKRQLTRFQTEENSLQLAYIEELNDEELDFFNVPDHFRPKKTVEPHKERSIEKPAEPRVPFVQPTPTVYDYPPVVPQRQPSRCHWVSIVVGSVAIACFIALAVLLALYVPRFPFFVSWVIGGAGTIIGGGLVMYGIYNRR